MRCFPSRSALVLLGALLCLAACTPTAIVSVPPTATTMPLPPTPTATSTPVLVPTPTNVPAGWRVLATPYFSMAYPPDWTPETGTSSTGGFVIWAPAHQSAVTVTVILQADVPQGELTLYCQPQSEGARPTTLANLPMTLQLAGIGNAVRVWRFVNAQQTLYLLQVGDAQADAATQAQHEAILATFRPDNATPWHC